MNCDIRYYLILRKYVCMKFMLTLPLSKNGECYLDRCPHHPDFVREPSPEEMGWSL